MQHKNYVYVKNDLDQFEGEDDYGGKVIFCKNKCIELIDSLNNCDEHLKEREIKLYYHTETKHGHLIKIDGHVGNMMDYLLIKISQQHKQKDEIQYQFYQRAKLYAKFLS